MSRTCYSLVHFENASKQTVQARFVGDACHKSRLVCYTRASIPCVLVFGHHRLVLSPKLSIYTVTYSIFITENS